jgi:hypothetical protein
MRDSTQWRGGSFLDRASPADELDNQYDDRDYQKKMNESTRNVEGQKAQQPENK